MDTLAVAYAGLWGNPVADFSSTNLTRCSQGRLGRTAGTIETRPISPVELKSYSAKGRAVRISDLGYWGKSIGEEGNRKIKLCLQSGR